MPPQLRKRPAPASDALPTASQCRWELRRFAAARRCPEISTVEDAYRFLSDIGAYADLPQFFRPCTKSNGQSCHLLDHLDTWNRPLKEMNMQIEEVAPETLSVAPRRRAFGSVEPEYCNLDGWILIHWLFKEHHCITNLQIPNPDRFPQLHLREVLCRNFGLKTLTLSYETSEEDLRVIVSTASNWTGLENLTISGLTLSEHTVSLLEASLQKLPLLKSLTISFASFGPACDAALLQGAFKRMSTLTSLSLSYASDGPRDVELVLRSLSPGLSVLNVDDRFLEPRGGAVFQEFLAGNTVLKKLTLYQKVCEGMSELDNVFGGLLLNHCLEELHLSGFGLKNATMELLAEAVAGHGSLKVLEVSFFDEFWEMDGAPLAKMLGRNKSLHELIFSVGEVDCFGAFADAVRKNTTLRKLSLNLVQLDDWVEVSVYRGFLEALSCNNTIQQVTLGSIYSCLVGSFSELLRKTGTERRVTFEVDMWDTNFFIEALGKCTGLTQMRYMNWYSKIPVPPSALRHLIYYYRIEDLEISPWNQLIEGDAVTPLVQLFASTRTLKSLVLAFRTTPASTDALLKGLSRNRSISSLQIHRWTFKESSASLLWQILRNNRLLNNIFIHTETNSDFEALSQFPEHLLDNHSLLSASFDTNSQDSKLKIQEVMRRNLSTLYRAVMFVMGSRGRRHVEAFERVSKSPALVKEVQKTASESEEEAKDRVRRTKDYLDENFLAAVGVVKDTVVCADNGQLQLDRIGLDNWLHIRQYLKVADIKDPAVQPSTSTRPQKRHRSRRYSCIYAS